MIRYLGGKTRLSKEISNLIMDFSQENNCETYIEPFVGGGSIICNLDKLNIRKIACDIQEDLILLYQDIQNGWTPPITVTEEEYKFYQNSKIASSMRGYMGFACSYGGKWFAGMARAKGRDMPNESYNRIIKDRHKIKDVSFLCHGYDLIDESLINEKTIIYCDPPYSNTESYSMKFDSEKFWNWVRYCSIKGSTVLVSEYNAPNDFIEVWKKEYGTYIHHQPTSNKKLEKIFTYRY